MRAAEDEHLLGGLGHHGPDARELAGLLAIEQGPVRSAEQDVEQQEADRPNHKFAKACTEFRTHGGQNCA